MNASRLDKLIAKKAQLEAQIQAVQSRERKQKRKDDTRRKIIAGALAVEHATQNPDSEFTRTMLHLIQNGVKSDRDRALFDLDPLPKSANAANDGTVSPSQSQRLWDRMTGR
ncbi:MAG: mobilization protein C [Pseudomonadota bacterium]